MKKKTAFLAALLALCLCINLPALAQAAQAAVPAAITAQEAVERYNAGEDCLFVDVRAQEEYDEAHIPTSVNVPLGQLAEAAPAALTSAQQQLFVYGGSGEESTQAAQALCEMGYSAVYDLGSFADWPYETISTARENAPFLGLFTATDIDGNAVDQTLFANHRLTMINVWATYCTPCLDEMPDLGQLHADMAAEGVQIVGLVSDALNSDGSISQSQVDLARDIIEATGANYPHLLPSQDLIEILLWQVTGVPTTIFVDSTGALVGYAYVGSRSYDDWAAIIEETLALLDANAAGEGAEAEEAPVAESEAEAEEAPAAESEAEAEEAPAAEGDAEAEGADGAQA